MHNVTRVEMLRRTIKLSISADLAAPWLGPTHGQSKYAIQLYHQMRNSIVKPDGHVIVAGLQACARGAALEMGQQVHADVLARDLDMRQQGMEKGNSTNLYRVLKESMAKKDLALGTRVHALIVTGGYEYDTFLANQLIRMYAGHGRLFEATEVFNKLAAPDTYVWASIISTYSEHGQYKQAIQLYRQMRRSPVRPNDYVFVAVLKACACAGDLAAGKEVHCDVVESGFELNVYVGNTLLDMYAKSGSLQCARAIFDMLPAKSVVTWTAMIRAYAQQRLGHEALDLYSKMQQDGRTIANEVTFVCLLKACASIGAVHEGRHLHRQIHDRGLQSDVAVGTTLVDMYAKCGSLEDAQSVFDQLPRRNVVTWGALIGGYVQHGLGWEAVHLFNRMQAEGVIPDRVVLICCLKACGSTGAIQIGKKLHSQIRERGLEDDAVVVNALLDMYSKCGRLEDARDVFDRVSRRDVVTWTVMIAGYAQNGFGQDAIDMYRRMQQDGTILANDVTLASTLKACGSVGAVKLGAEIHAQILERGAESNILLGNSLVDMYAKCGSLENARKVFDRLPAKDVVTWTALIKGYGQHNDCKSAIECMEEMLHQGVEPDAATFVCILAACSHVGLVKEGEQYFKMMVRDYGISPSVDHYICMVDGFGRSGQLDEAEAMLQTLPFVDQGVGWKSLLNACRCHGDMERGRRCFDFLAKLEPQQAGSYVLMSNIYANAGQWDEVRKMEQLRKTAGASKKPAMASVQVGSMVREFIVGQERSDIASKLKSMNLRLRAEGHRSHTELVLKSISEPEKEDALCGHAEKLALAYGLLNTPEGSTLVITKNLRMCNDCHSGTKILSRIEKREIIIRDAHRVHHFRDGFCSCKDSH